MVIPNNLLVNVCKFLQPDITLKINSDNGTPRAQALAFHELAHASHWTKVGCSYWVKYINYIITYGMNGEYGSGNGNNSGYCEVGEMWGNYFGNYVLPRAKFGYDVSWTHDEKWFNPGFLMNVDNIPDVTAAEIFSCLDATSISGLKTNLKTKTANGTQVDNAYSMYTDWP